MRSPGKPARLGDDLEALVAVERSPAFDAALARLLEAHHADVQRARLGRSAELAGLASGPQASRESPLAGAGRGGGERRGADRKGPDTQVGPLGCEWEQQETFIADAHGADGLCSNGQGNGHLACSRSSLSSASIQSGATSSKGDMDGVGGFDTIDRIIRPSQYSRGIQRPSWLGKYISGTKFEVGTSIVLFLFCVITALEMQGEGTRLGYELGYPRYTDPEATFWPEAVGVLQVLSICFGGVFMFEVLLRLVAAPRQFLFDRWNLFDVVILGGWLLEFTGKEFNSKILRTIRLVRMLRFLRLIKIAMHLEGLYFMLKAFQGCWGVLGWACVLLLALQSFTACVISQVLFTTYFSDEGRPIEERMEVFTYFGSFVRALLTTFEMTMANWPIPARILVENVSEWFMWLFLIHKLVVGFAFIGVVNGIFVQETLQIAMTDDLTMVLKKQRHMRTQRRKLEKLFRAADSDSNGRVSRPEFARILKNSGVRLWLASMDYDPKDPNYLFDLLDKDGGGDLSASEFLRGMTHLRGFARAMDVLHLDKQQEHVQRLVKSSFVLPTPIHWQTSRAPTTWSGCCRSDARFRR
ncbi:unnamed protein product [Prorocentrum cordatum]|uniref:EF-hand domain-containing protein n=1 Tax=Prorocentrum cordatum TaxID=2364126 RepID=A0ABN9VB18_9DINO|nr:unnamed protein product [Polarella glacialis]